jgi:hypothetical protein
MDKIICNDIKCRVNRAYNNIVGAFNEAREALEQSLIEAEGLIKTIPTNDKPEIHSISDCAGLDNPNQTIYGIRYIEGEGIFICNEDCLRNYETDTGYEFNAGGDDAKELEKVLEDTAYFVDIDDWYFDINKTIWEIVGCIDAYIE